MDVIKFFDKACKIVVLQPKVDIIDLYILIPNTDAKWVPKELMDDSDVCM